VVGDVESISSVEAVGDVDRCKGDSSEIGGVRTWA
jgi:hypothetical protein